jgi:hypothetical protein
MRSGVIFFWTSFVIGVITGWALSQISRAPVGAVIAATIGVGSVAWCAVTFRRTKGTFADIDRDAVINTSLGQVTAEPKTTQLFSVRKGSCVLLPVACVRASHLCGSC